MSNGIMKMAQGVATFASRSVLTAKKNSPAVMFGAGVVGMVGTAVLASKATLKLDEVLEETESLKGQAQSLVMTDNPKYTQADFESDMRKIHVRQIMKVGKLYLPAIALGIASIALLAGSHIVLTRRNTALMAAYAAIDQGFKKYRERVIADVGLEKDFEYRHGVVEEEIETTTKKGDKRKKVVKKPGDPSDYARVWDENNKLYVSGSPEMNLAQLRMNQTYFNHMLSSQGHLFLNEVYDQLGYERTAAGSVVGWIYGGDGDGFVDLGIWDDDQMENLMSFMNHSKDSLILDFNVDGVIYDKI